MPKKQLIVEIVRALDDQDARTGEPIGAGVPALQSIRASHHQLAQLIAQGRPDTEVSLITGYSTTRISSLKADPSFAELLDGYGTIRQQIFVDTLERMRVLGLSTLDELQERLETAPEKWTNRELMEMADLMLVKPRIATPLGQSSALGGASQQTSNAGQKGVVVNVKFVASDTPQLVIDGKPEPVDNE